jgi:hypothetical protein
MGSYVAPEAVSLNVSVVTMTMMWPVGTTV